MIVTLNHGDKIYHADLSKGIDLSLAVCLSGPRAWYVKPPVIHPVINRHFTGSVRLGGSVNFFDIAFNPHGHGTHTESVGHISPDHESVNACLQQFFFLAQVISVAPAVQGTDKVIIKSQVENMVGGTAALIIRTLPNAPDKKTKDYSNSNFPYVHHEAMAYIADAGVEHLLIDLPSVDREEDEGKLLAHRAFWKYPTQTRSHCTITEFVFVPDHVADGLYLLNLQVAAFDNDAAPSRPVIYALAKG